MLDLSYYEKEALRACLDVYAAAQKSVLAPFMDEPVLGFIGSLGAVEPPLAIVPLQWAKRPEAGPSYLLILLMGSTSGFIVGILVVVAWLISG